MASTQEPIMAAGLLSSLAGLFFKGLDKAISKNAEYEEEMGVLKQINRIEIEDEDGKKYTLTIKLSPVRSKNNYYFVEADTTAPGLDVSKINNKTMQINNSNVRQFNALVDKILDAKGYENTNPLEDQPMKEAEVVGEAVDENGNPDDSKSDNIISEGEVEKLVDDATEAFKDEPVVAVAPSLGVIQIEVTFADVTTDNCTVHLVGIGTYDQSNNIVVDEDTFNLQPVDSKGNIKDLDDFIGEIMFGIQDYAINNHLDKNSIRRGVVNGSTLLSISLLKEKTGDVCLTAINASCDIKSAMDVLDDLTEDSEFLDNLVEDEEQSFAVLDDGDSYDVQEVESIDISNTYKDFFLEIYKAHRKLQAYMWAFTVEKWVENSFFDTTYKLAESILETAAEWVVSHDSEYPFGAALDLEESEFTPFEELLDEESDTISEEKLSAYVFDALNTNIYVALGFYYPNFEADEQETIDDFNKLTVDTLALADTNASKVEDEVSEDIELEEAE